MPGVPLQGGQGGEGCVTFGGLAVPDHEGTQHVARGQKLALRILPADALEEPPGGKGLGALCEPRSRPVLSHLHGAPGDGVPGFLQCSFSYKILLGKITIPKW